MPTGCTTKIRLEVLFNARKNFIVVGKAVFGALGKNEVAVDFDFEDAAP